MSVEIATSRPGFAIGVWRHLIVAAWSTDAATDDISAVLTAITATWDGEPSSLYLVIWVDTQVSALPRGPLATRPRIERWSRRRRQAGSRRDTCPQGNLWSVC